MGFWVLSSFKFCPELCWAQSKFVGILCLRAHLAMGREDQAPLAKKPRSSVCTSSSTGSSDVLVDMHEPPSEVATSPALSSDVPNTNHSPQEQEGDADAGAGPTVHEVDDSPPPRHPHRPQPGMPDSDSGSGSDEGMPSPRSWDSVELVDVAPTPTLFSISDGELSALGSGEEEEEEEESLGGPDSSTEMIFDSISISSSPSESSFHSDVGYGQADAAAGPAPFASPLR